MGTNNPAEMAHKIQHLEKQVNALEKLVKDSGKGHSASDGRLDKVEAAIKELQKDNETIWFKLNSVEIDVGALTKKVKI